MANNDRDGSPAMAHHETRADVIDAYVQRYSAVYDQLADAPDVGQLWSPDLFRIAIDESVSKRRPYGLLRQAPTFAERPLGSLLLRLVRWHRGNGELTSYFIAREDALCLGRMVARFAAGDAPEWIRPWLKSHPGAVAELAGYETDVWDVTETTATAIVVAGGGRSTAAEAWERALGRTS